VPASREQKAAVLSTAQGHGQAHSKAAVAVTVTTLTGAERALKKQEVHLERRAGVAIRKVSAVEG